MSLFIETRIKSDGPPVSGRGIRLALYQVRAGLSGSQQAIDENLDILKKGAAIAGRDYQAHLISFPELFLTGYAFESNQAAYEVCQTIEEMEKMIAPVAQEHRIAILCPYPEKAVLEGKIRYYDSMILIDEKGKKLRNYRKTHLWGPGEQSLWSFGYVYASEGEPYTVERVNDFPLGVLNCYEAEFSELARILALKGALLAVIPTAADFRAVVLGEWTRQPYPDISKTLIPAHSYENIMFIAYNNATGTGYIIKEGEKIDQVVYRGNSVIADPHGQVMVAARPSDETLLIADCIPTDYGPAHPFNTNYIKDRRPSLYSELIAEKINRYDWTYPVPPKPIYDEE